MIDFSPIGHAGRQTAQSSQKKSDPGSASFDALLHSVKEQAVPQPGGSTVHASGHSVLGPGNEAACTQVRQTYEALVKDTEAEYGHLPHDDLRRIMAMAKRMGNT